MKTVEATYRIEYIPDGEEALARIERLGRVAYKSEGRVRPGKRCGCNTNPPVEGSTCSACGGSGWLFEPSSHRFVRMLLAAERKAKLARSMEQPLRDWAAGPREPMLVDVPLLSEKLASNVLAYMREHPAHESVIEHCSATVVLTTNRGVTHELVRHRLASFTQESTRYCDYGGKQEVQVVGRTSWGVSTEEAAERAMGIWYTAMQQAEAAYIALRSLSVPPEIARDVLPNALKADIAITANFREWRHIFRMRNAPGAHPDMRKLMGSLHEEFRKRIPIIFDWEE